MPSSRGVVAAACLLACAPPKRGVVEPSPSPPPRGIPGTAPLPFAIAPPPHCAPHPIPKCPVGLEALTLAEATRPSDRLLGHEVTVRGPLRATLPICGENVDDREPCFGYLVLATHDDVPLERGARDAILLDPYATTTPLVCRGGPAGLCCTVDATGDDVIVRGLLGRGGWAKESRTWSLAYPELCAP